MRYLREEFFGNNEHQPGTRAILQAVSERWGQNVDQKELYQLFPGDPSKQAGRIAGPPESRRKGDTEGSAVRDAGRCRVERNTRLRMSKTLDSSIAVMSSYAKI